MLTFNLGQPHTHTQTHLQNSSKNCASYDSYCNCATL